MPCASLLTMSRAGGGLNKNQAAAADGAGPKIGDAPRLSPGVRPHKRRSGDQSAEPHVTRHLATTPDQSVTTGTLSSPQVPIAL